MPATTVVEAETDGNSASVPKAVGRQPAAAADLDATAVPAPHRSRRASLPLVLGVVGLAVVVASALGLAWRSHTSSASTPLSFPVSGAREVALSIEGQSDLACVWDETPDPNSHTYELDCGSTKPSDTSSETNRQLHNGCAPGIHGLVYQEQVSATSNLALAAGFRLSKSCPDGARPHITTWLRGNVALWSSSSALDAIPPIVLGTSAQQITPVDYAARQGAASTPAPTPTPAPGVSQSDLGLAPCPADEHVATHADATYYDPPFVLVRGACVGPDGRTIFLRYDGVGPGSTSTGCTQLRWNSVGGKTTPIVRCPFNQATTVRLTPISSRIAVSWRLAPSSSAEVQMGLSEFLAEYTTAICSTPKCTLPPGDSVPLVLLLSTYSGPGSPDVFWTGGQVTAVEDQTAISRRRPAAPPPSAAVSEMVTGLSPNVDHPGLSPLYDPVFEASEKPVVVEPGILYLAPGLGLYFDPMSWSSWDSKAATGSGIVHVQDPTWMGDAGSWPMLEGQVDVSLSEPVSTPCGVFFSTLRYSFSGTPPKGLKSTQTLTGQQPTCKGYPVGS